MSSTKLQTTQTTRKKKTNLPTRSWSQMPNINAVKVTAICGSAQIGFKNGMAAVNQ